MNSVYDCIIVGAGPAGAFCAWRLASQNLKVLLIESSKHTKRKVCGEYLCPKGVQLLHESGLGDYAESNFNKLHGMKIFTSRNSEVYTRFPNAGPFSYGLSLNREKFDRHLLNLCHAVGVEVHKDESFVDFTSYDEICEIRTSKGAYKTRVLIGADGRKSKVAQKLGFSEEATNHRVAIHAYLEPKTAFERMGEMHILSDSSYFGIDPIHENEINISLVCDGESVRKHGGMLKTWNHYIQQSPKLLKEFGCLDENTPLYAVSPIQHRVKSIHSRNIVLIGDAAGFVDPITGEGIFNAICSAKILSDELIKARTQSLTNYKPGVARYAEQHKKTLAQKAKLNRVFQWVIRHPSVVEFIAQFLKKSATRANAFVGVIGNIYSPQQGLIEMFKRKAS
jgi:menaquinone-9 beta-reductase